MNRRQANAVEVPARILSFPENLLNRLDALASEFVSWASRRIYPRYRYRRTVELTIDLPGEDQASLRVCTRNLSNGGLSFLHTEPVPLDSEITLSLPDLHGNLHVLGAVVRASRIVEESIHEMGVEFHQPIDVTTFIGVDPEFHAQTG